MAVDPYGPCPCGSGKKAKFCCGDMLHELEQIQRMQSAKQWENCLTYIDELLKKFPDRPSLLSIKSQVLAKLGRVEQLSAVTDELLQKDPHNTVALSEKVLTELSEKGAQAGIQQMQRALEAAQESVPQALIQSLITLAQVLEQMGLSGSALAHFDLLVDFLEQGNVEIPPELRNIWADPNVPLLIKDDRPLAMCPEDAPYSEEFREAMADGGDGLWQMAARRFAALGEKHPECAAIWRNLARMYNNLADARNAAAAYRRLLSLDLPLEEKVEAEAAAHLSAIDPTSLVDAKITRITISDAAECKSRLDASPRAVLLRVPPTGEEGQPRPQAAYGIADKPIPESVEGLSVEQYPVELAAALLYGKETDREARIEFLQSVGDSEATIAALREICGNLGEITDDVVSKRWDEMLALSLVSPMAKGIQPEQVREFRQWNFRQLINRWPEQRFAYLNGTPAEAVKSEEGRLKVLASLLIAETMLCPPDIDYDFNDLRRTLNLPTLELIKVDDSAMWNLPPVRLLRVDVTQLSTETLRAYCHRLGTLGIAKAAETAFPEVVKRPDTSPEEIALAYSALAGLVGPTAQSLEYIEKARASAGKIVPLQVRLDLQELEIRLERREFANVEPLVRRLANSYNQVPQARVALFELMSRWGLVTEDGKMIVPKPKTSSIIVPGAQNAEPGKIWTPEGAAAGSSPGEKPGLWVPGMD